MTPALFKFTLTGAALALFCACSEGPATGPDKQFEGSLSGAASGAGAGAVTGFQLGAGAGPGAAVGAGFGALAGGIQGFMGDQQDEAVMKTDEELEREHERAWAQQVLSVHYQKRSELFPTRDIFPSDLFFTSDQAELNHQGRVLAREIAELQKKRLPWSTLVIASYVRATSPESSFAKYLAEKRAREISDEMVRAGLEPRRLKGRAVIISEPLVLDPSDRPDRYNQAIEIIPLDR